MRGKELDSQRVIIMAVVHLPDETFLKVDFLKIIIFEYLVSKFSGPLLVLTDLFSDCFQILNKTAQRRNCAEGVSSKQNVLQ